MFDKSYNKVFYGLSTLTFVALVAFNQPIGESFRASLIPLMFPLGQYMNKRFPLVSPRKVLGSK